MAVSIFNIGAQRDIGRDRRLAPYACDWRHSRGRFTDEPSATDRTPYQRDRDRILHCEAFRRLQYKTQVYTNTRQGDHFRTRLTHTLEVAQIARSLCRTFNLDEDLGETVALAHDLGHPPFGHAGEDALNNCMAPWGGFWHNAQTMRILRQLEQQYALFDGLNLTWEALNGTANHNGPLHQTRHAVYAQHPLFADLEPNQWCGLEGQIAAIADDIAYNHHDMEDGIRCGNLTVKQLCELPQFKRVYDEVMATYPGIDDNRLVREIKRRMISRQVKDVLDESRSRIQRANPQTVDDVRRLDQPLINCSAQVAEENRTLKTFLMEHMYRHHQQNRMGFRAHRIVNDLFQVFFEHRRTLPEAVQRYLPQDKNDDAGKARVVCDYIASMTDRSIMNEYALLFGDVNYKGY